MKRRRTNEHELLFPGDGPGILDCGTHQLVCGRVVVNPEALLWEKRITADLPSPARPSSARPAKPGLLRRSFAAIAGHFRPWVTIANHMGGCTTEASKEVLAELKAALEARGGYVKYGDARTEYDKL